jgi:hypothetical protein
MAVSGVSTCGADGLQLSSTLLDTPRRTPLPQGRVHQARGGARGRRRADADLQAEARARAGGELLAGGRQPHGQVDLTSRRTLNGLSRA